MGCSQNFSRSKLPELQQFSREASWRWTQCASWRRMWQSVGSRCLSTTTTDISSTTDFGGTLKNFSQTDCLTLADIPMHSISIRRTFRNWRNSSNSKTTFWKQLKMPLVLQKPFSRHIPNQAWTTSCLWAFTAGRDGNLFEEREALTDDGVAGALTCCQKCTGPRPATPELTATSTTRQWPCSGTLTRLPPTKKAETEKEKLPSVKVLESVSWGHL